jgi:excisionase family DNA binding protein
MPSNLKRRMQNESSPILSATQWANKGEIARHFKCSARHINKLMRRRILPFVKIGRFVRFDVAACDQAMKSYQTKSLFA